MSELERELEKFISDQLDEFTAKTLGITVPPAWAWSSEWLEPYYLRSLKTIFLPKEFLIRAFLLVPKKTKRALRGSLGHEFWHYVQDVRGDPLVVKGIVIAQIPTLTVSENIAERVAIKRAVFLTGISHAEHLRDWEDISSLVMSSFIRRAAVVETSYSFLFDENLPTQDIITVTAVNQFEAAIKARDEFTSKHGVYHKTVKMLRTAAAT